MREPLQRAAAPAHQTVVDKLSQGSNPHGVHGVNYPVGLPPIPCYPVDLVGQARGQTLLPGCMIQPPISVGIRAGIRAGINAWNPGNIGF